MFFVFRLAIPILMVLPSVPGMAGVSDEVSAQLERLKSSDASPSQRDAASQIILALGKAALPPLIDCVGDSTPVGETPVRGGECVNRPAHLPVPPRCARPYVAETLGDRCESLLYRIVTPVYTSPYTFSLTLKQAPPRPFVVLDWRKWWRSYRGKSLEEIREDAKAMIDAFWIGDARRSVAWDSENTARRSGLQVPAWESRLGKRVRLVGVAQNAKLGAVVVVEGRPVYLAGRDGWESSIVGRTVRVEGVLRDFTPPEAASQDGAWSAGVGRNGRTYRLEDPRWQFVP